MIDYGKWNLSGLVSGGSQFYTQQSNIVYMLYGWDKTLDIIDLATKVFTPNWQGVTLNVDVGYQGCLASTPGYLYVLGGYIYWYGPYDNLQVFDVTEMEWISNTPSMGNRRMALACLVHDGLLYAIGGAGPDDSELPTIEKIKVDNIENEQWTNTSYPLLEPVRGLKAISFGSDILVFGGMLVDGSAVTAAVQVIDSITEIVTMAVDMNYGIASAPVINVNNRLYVFGGEIDGGVNYKKWQYYDLLSCI